MIKVMVLKLKWYLKSKHKIYVYPINVKNVAGRIDLFLKMNQFYFF